MVLVRRNTTIWVIGLAMSLGIAVFLIGFFFQKNYSNKENVAIARHFLRSFIDQQKASKLKNGSFEGDLKKLSLKLPSGMFLLTGPDEAHEGISCVDCNIEGQSFKVMLIFRVGPEYYSLKMDQQGLLSGPQKNF